MRLLQANKAQNHLHLHQYHLITDANKVQLGQGRYFSELSTGLSDSDVTPVGRGFIAPSCFGNPVNDKVELYGCGCDAHVTINDQCPNRDLGFAPTKFWQQLQNLTVNEP